MAGNDLIVGNPDCEYSKLCDILIKYNSTLTKWLDVARKLNVPPDIIFTTRNSLNLGMITHYSAFFNILEGWRANAGRSATLDTFLETLEELEEYDTADEIRQKFHIPLPPFHLRPRIGIRFEIRKQAHSCITRSEELVALHSKLEETQKMTVVSGLGGIGKTVLCHQYIDNYGEFYQDIIWIIANNKAGVEATFRRLADDDRVGTRSKTTNDEMKDIKTVVAQVFEFFAKRKSLFIFDNVERKRDIAEFLPHLYIASTSINISKLDKVSSQPQILITSRNSDWDEGQYLVHELHGIKKDSALDFVQSRLNTTEEMTGSDTEKLVELLSHRDLCYPLALQQAIAYIKDRRRINNNYVIRNYIDDYRTMKETLLKSNKFQDEGTQDFYEYTTFTTWHITIEAISREHELSMKVFNAMAYLNPDRIERKMFIAGTGQREDDLMEAVDVLVRFSMISSDSDGEPQSILSIHRLVQDVTKEKLKIERTAMPVLKSCLRMLNNPAISNELQHAASVWSSASEYSELIEEHYSISIYGRGEETPLHLLSNKDLGDYSDAFKAIVQHFKNTSPYHISVLRLINSKDKFDRTPIWMASLTGNSGVVKLLIEEGADLDTKSNIVTFFSSNDINAHANLGETPLHVSARNGHITCVQHLISADTNLKNLKNITNRTPAMVAAYNGQVKVVEILKPGNLLYLLHAKLHNAVDNFKEFKDFVTELNPEERRDLIRCRLGSWTALHQAASRGYPPSLLSFLKDNGAVVMYQNNFGPLHGAAQYDCLEAAKYLCSLKNEGVHPLKNVNHEGWTPIHEASRMGSINTLKYFIEDYEYQDDIMLDDVVNVRDDKNDTPLHTAAFHGKKEVVQYLLEKGASVNVTNCWGATPAWSGALTGFFEGVNLILNCGQELTINLEELPNNENSLLAQLGISLVHLAAAYNKTEVVRKLIEQHGMDINVGKDKSLTPLHASVFFGSKGVTEYLLRNGGADVNAKIKTANIIKVGHSYIDNGALYVPEDRIKKILKCVNYFRNSIDYFFTLTAGSLCKLEFCQTDFSELSLGGRQVDCPYPGIIVRNILSHESVKKYLFLLLSYVQSRAQTENADLVMQGNEIVNIGRFVGLY
ncbi:unnamed protein product [Orchesella dallaii]|uniref:Death domain-containing protein n=1 Tax=Orchesella dallaii TaxID=48710 RepID=A0ABP1RS41_9HEXA